MEKICIIGSGNVGANTAFFIAEKGIEDVCLLDSIQGISTGKSLDMMEAAPIRKYRNRIRGIDDFGDASGSEAVVIAAGRSCPPGGTSDGLLQENWKMVRDIADSIQLVSPGGILIVATEPVDMLVGLIARHLRIPRERIIGLGGVLDSTRLKAAIARELGISVDNVTAMMIGRHTRDMIPLLEYTRVSGIPVAQLMPDADIERLMDEVRSADRVLSELSECSGAYYAPSAAAAEIVEAIHGNLKRILPVSVVLNGEYGISGVAMSLPCVIGAGGVERVLTPELSDADHAALKRSAAALADIIEGMEQ